jgi:hypothetical protein
MHIEYEDKSITADPVQFCVDMILKEARDEDRLVKQLVYVMLSAYTNNPFNLAINAPTGVGKSYIINKVLSYFPSVDTVALNDMTAKAIFHRSGKLVVKNNDGGYDSIEERLQEIDDAIEDKQEEADKTSNYTLKKALLQEVKELVEEKKDLLKNSKKLIDLSHKVLVFFDSPRPELLNAIMSLLSHDKHEVEYDFVDTHNGIKTKSNVLSGWPAVIFAQAIDITHYDRYQEIQRRFIITNPEMTEKKYEQAIDLISKKFGLPDLVYQATIISDLDKQKVRETILKLRDEIRKVCDSIEPGKNNGLSPFNETVQISMQKQNPVDMTTANRLFGIMSLSSIVNIGKRPRILVRQEGNPIAQTIHFILFEDLKDAIYLMEYAVSGVRPYILERYQNVFLEAYNAKTECNSKIDSKDNLIEENRIAVTTAELVDKTFEIEKKKLSTKQIYQTYITPLLNDNFIDSIHSELDKRAYIYFPIVTSKYSKLFLSDQRNNFLQSNKVSVVNPALYPDKTYVNSEIQLVWRYYSENANLKLKLGMVDHEGNEIIIDQLVDKYYRNPENYFSKNFPDNDNAYEEEANSTGPNNAKRDDSDGRGDVPHQVIYDQTIEDKMSDVADQTNDSNSSNSLVESNHSAEKATSDYYLQNPQIAIESQQSQPNNIGIINSEDKDSDKLFQLNERNNYLYLNESHLDPKIIPTSEANSSKIGVGEVEAASIVLDLDEQNNVSIQEEQPPTTAAVAIETSTIYRLGHSDIFACNNCKQRGDKWYMRQHLPAPVTMLVIGS